MKFAYRSSSGNIVECNILGDAVHHLRTNGSGTICKLTSNNKWYPTDIENVHKDVRRKVALYYLHRLAKQGYSELGSDESVPCADSWGTFWWMWAREATLSRDGDTCRLCSSDKELHVHHIMPKSEGGADNPLNLITVCNTCHKLIHRNSKFTDLRIHKTQTRLEAYT
ncbi:MAG TPA: HNH endonuclease [Candidatus Methanomethylophilaceae archaeon]|nr:HNH endonuclease [Candidatus Methanomethylophilaceae archaeon]